MNTELLFALIVVGLLFIAYFTVTIIRALDKSKAKEELSGLRPAETDKEIENVFPEKESVQAAEPLKEGKKISVKKKEPTETGLFIGDLEPNTKLVINRLSFSERLAAVPQDVKGFYDEIYNAFTVYKNVIARTTFKCLSVRFNKELVAKVFIKGKTMKLALKLNATDYPENVYHQKDMSDKKTYAEVPCVVKIKSERATARAKELIDDMFLKAGAVRKSRSKGTRRK